jgi:hypothetical protein
MSSKATPMLLTSTVNDVRTKTGGMYGATKYAPKTTPNTPGIPAKRSARLSIGMWRYRILREAAPMPTLWIAREKLRASRGAMCRSFVKMGNAIAPPPSLVPPPTREPKTMVSATFQSANRWWIATLLPKINHSTHTNNAMVRLKRSALLFGLFRSTTTPYVAEVLDVGFDMRGTSPVFSNQEFGEA